MDNLRSLGGLLLVLGVIALIVGYVVEVGVLVTLGWVGAGVGLALVVAAALGLVGGRHRL